MKKTLRMMLALVAALAMVFFGFLVSWAGFTILHEWHSIGRAYAAFGVSWILSGPLMLVAGCWVAASAGRKQTALWMGGTASIVAGILLIAGVVARVIPCSGPS